jgi:hypothetical protein
MKAQSSWREHFFQGVSLELWLQAESSPRVPVTGIRTEPSVRPLKYASATAAKLVSR